ncbi:uncharacterized protein LOC114119501 isoform X2 [Aphis gossypii]|uniref:uncharacterized protein LOC114119501 isoform X2 n=1 Tax=Aphis gossypii TaxID=80765 RepID=UPI0021592602|nr:uncharacterized protein LOC114119501 isoform X2 [Aphis gossypii]
MTMDKLLNKLDEKEQDEAKTPEEECVICVNSKATMQTWPCGHRVVCRKCLVRTIQIAVSRRSLPLRCVVCRARVLRLKRSSDPRAASTAVAAPTEGGRDVATSSGRSHSLPTKLRRHVTASVAVRSRSVGTGKTSHVRRTTSGGGYSGGSSGGGRRRHNFAGWADAFATDEDDDDGGGGDDDEDEDDYDDSNGVAGGGRYQTHATSVKYSKLESTADRMRHDNQSKNGLQRILGKFKFWRFLRFKNNKP